MEEQTPQAPKNNMKKAILIGLGTVVVGTLTFFGIQFYNNKQKRENKNDNNNNNDGDGEDKPARQTQSNTGSSKGTAAAPKNPANHKPDTGLPANHALPSFPLVIGAKGEKVRTLQLAIINRYGASVLPKYGADGWFGKELASALRARGYTVPLPETSYKEITEGKTEQNQTPAPPPDTLTTFDATSAAKLLFMACQMVDFASAMTVLKTIKNTTDYALTNELFKNYLLRGVRQTIVNAVLSTFLESSQKQQVQTALKNIGLKYDGQKWSIN